MSYPSSFQFNQKQQRSLKQTQHLIMSHQMQQAIGILQLPVQELAAVIEEEMERNPILEYSEEYSDTESYDEMREEANELNLDAESPMEQELSFDESSLDILRRLDRDFRDHFNQNEDYSRTRTQEEEKKQAYLESTIRKEASLFEYLMKQAEETFDTKEELEIAEAIIGNIDEKGFLGIPLEEIAYMNQWDLPHVEEIHQEILKFHPIGVGAKDLREALLIQLKQKGLEASIAYRIVQNHYDDLIHNRVPVIRKAIGTSSRQVADAIDRVISKLDTHPGLAYSRPDVQPVVPDVIIREENGELSVEVSDEYVPNVHINRKYLRLLDDPESSTETKEFVRQKLLSAKWLLRNIHERNSTLEGIAKILIEKQRDFFLKPEGQLVPLTMKSIAAELGVHESTVARTVANKWLYCGKGVFPLRAFFPNAYVTEEGEDISSSTVKDLLFEILEREDKKKPFSDEQISRILKKKGIQCARRTIAKYRLAFGIGNAHQRRKFG